MHDEEKGKADIAALSKDGRAHLSHVIRNGLQAISGYAERGQGAEAYEQVQELGRKLQEDLGL